ncbi:phage portal protein [Streptomyces sp. ME02-6979.5a]|uniref:phage portal protein n=1 Tax=unclassified Streptomyces TaxID=2593676 RepID=UPI0029B5C6C7|nr:MULTISPECIES: phage portal protein [unclassified Streptomyces]MDX3343702.1 phage portal protein [Streptomyces sp. ME02-6979.5a]MDX5526216.1 phage portal protein [Streptomyces sp. DE06-01C]
MSLFGLFENRASLENPATPLTDASLAEWMGGGPPVEAGVTVTETGALHMPAVWRAVSVVANVSASLPLHTYTVGTKDRATVELLEDPHPELTRFELWRLVYVHRLLWGNAYVQKIRNGAGVVVQLWPVRPDRVKVDKEPPTQENPSGKVFWIQVKDGGPRVRRTSKEILHLPALGYDGVTGCSPIRAAAQGIGLGIAAERAAGRLYGSGNMISGVLQTEQRLKPDQAANLKANWKARYGGSQAAHDVAILDSGASFHPVTMPYKDSQFLESRMFQVTEVSRMFGVPPFLLMSTEKSTSWGTGLEQQAQGFVTWDLAPTWLTPTEQRVTKELLPKTVYAKYQLGGLLRGDSSARATFYRAMRDSGAYSANDIRDLEDLTPIAGPEGDMRLQPLYMAPLGYDPSVKAPADLPPDADRAARAADHLAKAAELMAAPETKEGSDAEDD